VYVVLCFVLFCLSAPWAPVPAFICYVSVANTGPAQGLWFLLEVAFGLSPNVPNLESLSSSQMLGPNYVVIKSLLFYSKIVNPADWSVCL